jgi:pilus assembly protein Flp/PilA
MYCESIWEGRTRAIRKKPTENQAGEKQMKNVKQLLMKLVVEDSGQDLIEYALVAALVGLGSVASISSLTNSLQNTFNGIGSALTNAVA